MRQNTFVRNTKPIQLSINEMCFYKGGFFIRYHRGGGIVNMIHNFFYNCNFNVEQADIFLLLSSLKIEHHINIHIFHLIHW